MNETTLKSALKSLQKNDEQSYQRIIAPHLVDVLRACDFPEALDAVRNTLYNPIANKDAVEGITTWWQGVERFARQVRMDDRVLEHVELERLYLLKDKRRKKK